MKITNHHELRRDVSIDCSSPLLTDQSYKNACDINVIMANYAKTGLLPSYPESNPIYLDNTQIPSLMEAFEITQKATEMFYSLPADIRKLMDNDPAQLEEFVATPENADLLLKHGMLIKKAQPLNQNTQLTDKQTTGGSHVENSTTVTKTA